MFDSDNYEVSISFVLTPQEFNSLKPSDLEILPVNVPNQIMMFAMGKHEHG